jgi:hypothetical protein
MNADEPQPVRRAVAWALIVLGWIWVALAGGCTLYFFGAAAWSLIEARSGGSAAAAAASDASWAPLILIMSIIVGGAGVLIGWLILSAGQALRGSRARVGLGWVLVVLGGLWFAQGAASALSMFLGVSAGRMSGQGLVLTAMVSLVPPAVILAAGVLVLRIKPKRD